MEESKTIIDMLQEPEVKEELKVEEAPTAEPEKEEVVEAPEEEPKPEVKEEPKAEVKEEPKAEESVDNTTSSSEKPEDTQDIVEEPEQPKKKYAGKFENPDDLEKAYIDLQTAFTKKSMAVSEKVKEAESLVDEREFEAMIDAEIETKAIDLINKTYATITDPEAQKIAAQYLMGYNTSGDIRYIEAYFNCLDRSVERQLQRQLTQISIETRQSYASRRNEIIYEPARKELMEIEAEDPDFIKENSEILVQALRSNPKTSVKEIRSLIKQVREKAVEDYKKTILKKPKVEKSAVVPTQKAPAPKPEDKPKKPERLMSVKEMLLNE